jgi:hypothetical protein
MSKTPLLFVGKLVNSPLLTAFPASSRKILSDFSFVTGLCKGLVTINQFINKTKFYGNKSIHHTFNSQCKFYRSAGIAVAATGVGHVLGVDF